ncbi:hypothetical protein EXIGLDRAFT_475472 [Exidia glandulosa HHB12029]|uniref:Uncharacterized protein n=1 Tax=Exidia glandulosa HHB12029 TaxID=1314781 RepID=A0A166NL52_EXIGL|nr:hypothetical protein EXIGLDRAFT_475472 [Exidia glandulosa HHB12029]
MDQGRKHKNLRLCSCRRRLSRWLPPEAFPHSLWHASRAVPWYGVGLSGAGDVTGDPRRLPQPRPVRIDASNQPTSGFSCNAPRDECIHRRHMKVRERAAEVAAVGLARLVSCIRALKTPDTPQR